MRNAGRLKLGYYPLPTAEGGTIRGMLAFGEEAVSVVDPCVGKGDALHQITSGANCRLYGIELDALRARTAQASGIQTIQGSAFDAQAKVEQFSLLYLNPPYDLEIGQYGNRRMEFVFLEHTYRWLKPGGVLVFVIPEDRLIACTDLLASHFRRRPRLSTGRSGVSPVQPDCCLRCSEAAARSGDRQEHSYPSPTCARACSNRHHHRR